MDTDDPLRGTGRTTGLILKAIATALLKPDEWIEFEDHAPCDAERADNYLQHLVVLCNSLGLILDIERQDAVIRLRSPISRLRTL